MAARPEETIAVLEPDRALSERDAIHLVGIGGAGMSAIARVLLGRGYRVSGCDQRDSPMLQALERAGACVYVGHDASHLQGVSLVVASSAVPSYHPELVEARRMGLSVWHRGAMLRALTEGYYCIAVGGIHGKTTTTALIVLLLRAAGLDPSFIVGGEVPELGGNGHAGKGPAFVIEADEYDRTFLALRPDVAVVTNVEWEHVDCYPDPEAIHGAFAEWITQVPAQGRVYLCRDDPGAWSLPRPQARLLVYGLHPEADWRAADVQATQEATEFSVLLHGVPFGRFRIRLPGEHNVRNALAALAVAADEGIHARVAHAVLAEFAGVARRFQVLGEADGVTVVDDYAHHPTEIRATLRGARQRYPDRRLVAVFQPHTFTRTRAFADRMAAALDEADQVLVTEVYAARESDPGDITGAAVAAAVPRGAGFSPTLEEAARWLLHRLRPGDVLLTIGAGDVTGLGPRLLDALRLTQRAAA
ncbi:MAG: UDP-N-acetylmuramate--L-alanine ligase, partial [Chloroflexia bacterium]